MQRFILTALVLAGSVIGAASGQAGQAQEVGSPASTDGAQPPLVTSLDPGLDLFFTYHHLIAEDINETYSYLPLIGGRFSFQTTSNLRTYVSVAYGQKSGNPYYDLPGFQTGEEATVKTVPIHLGLKYNVAQSTRVRVSWGIAFVLAWTSETLPGQLDGQGQVGSVTSSDLTNGFMISFAPEFLLGDGPDSRHALGAEVGLGGTKGTLDGHDIDLTGYYAQLFWAYRF